MKKMLVEKTKFINSRKSNNPTPNSGATSLPPIGKPFMYIETSQNKSDSEKIFVSFGRPDKNQSSIIRFSIFLEVSLKSIGRFSIQLLLIDDIWSTPYKTPEDDRYNDSSTH